MAKVDYKLEKKEGELIETMVLHQIWKGSLP